MFKSAIVIAVTLASLVSVPVAFAAEKTGFNAETKKDDAGKMRIPGQKKPSDAPNLNN